MKSVKIDLHLHTVLSPCGDLLMTPLNIIKKAVEKNIEVIAITDHNSAANVKVTRDLAINYPVKIIPGIEVETREEIHLLCLFKKYNSLLNLHNYIYDNLPPEENIEDIFGPQIIVDIENDFAAREKRLLATSTNLSINEVVEKVYELNGIVIPSHIDKNYGLIKNLGLIPQDLSLSNLEVFKKTDIEKLKSKYPYLENYNLLKNSDSHYLDEIEAQMEIKIDKVDISNVFKALKSRKLEFIML